MHRTEIIAEIAQGFEGNPQLAKLLVNGAVVAGANSVKIQMVYADELCVANYPYYKLFKSLEMPVDVWSDLVTIAHNKRINIYFDIYGMESLKVAQDIGCDGVKISTTDFYNENLVQNSFTVFENVFISTCGIPVSDIDNMVNNCPQNVALTLLHGFQAEPTPISSNNMARISTLKQRYNNIRIGFMDHSLGSSSEAFYLPMIALGFKVACIEKHITLDYALKLEDYISALSVDRFKEFVQLIRKYESALGASSMKMTEAENKYRNKSGKVVISKRIIEKGVVLKIDDLVMKRVTVDPLDHSISKMKDAIGKTTTIELDNNVPLDTRYLID